MTPIFLHISSSSADLLPGLLKQALQRAVPVPGGVLLQELSEWVEVFEDAVKGAT